MSRFTRFFPIFLGMFFFIFITAKSQEINFNDYLKSADIIILKENTEIQIVGQKAYFIDVIVNKQISYKINKAEGISKVENLELPEMFDKTFIIHTTSIRKNATRFSGVKVKDFSSTIEKPDGTINTIIPEISMISDRVYTSGLGEVYSYNYHFKDLQEGDILNVTYSYTFYFKDNWEKLLSTRIFFHSEFPKMDCYFSLSHSSNLVVDTSLVHLTAPMDMQTGNINRYGWHFSNLPGCLNEPGSRPYKELPHFIFSILPYELIYEDFNSYKQYFIPVWLLLSLNRESNIRSIVMDQAVGSKDKDNLIYDKLAERITKRVGDDLNGIRTIQYFQRWMADSVKYNDSKEYYDNQKNYTVSRPSSDLTGGIIMDYAIESVYATMILKFGLNFFTAYPCDSRFGEMSHHYCAPMYNNDLIFATILKNNIVMMLVPRSEFNQYYCEELPFYYEDIPVILLHTNDFGGYKANILDTVRVMKTPGSEMADNFRRTNSTVNIELDQSVATFSTEIILSGQYSTLCRPAYFEKATDSTLNPDYHHKIWATGAELELMSMEKKIKEYAYPYTANVNANYRLSGIVTQNEEAYRIDLGKFIYHIGYQGFDSVYRFTDFYPDFTGSDRYSYRLVFDKEIELVQSYANFNINNDLVNYSFAIRQESSNVILLQSYVAWKKAVIPKQYVAELNALLTYIQKNKALFLTLKKK